ncbi:MAG: AAA family ATPase [Pseudomonadota bacterium]
MPSASLTQPPGVQERLGGSERGALDCERQAGNPGKRSRYGTLQRDQRLALVGLFLEHGARVRVVHAEAPEPTLRARNTARAVPVPEPAQARMIERWEPPTPEVGHEVMTARALELQK